MALLIRILNTLLLFLISAYALSFTPLYQWLDDNVGLPLDEAITGVIRNDK